MTPSASASVPEPPLDPEEWTDDEWISYLEQSDETFSDAFTQPVEPLLGKVTKPSRGLNGGFSNASSSRELVGINQVQLTSRYVVIPESTRIFLKSS